MANQHETLTALFGDIAAALREKTGDTADIVADTFPAAIRALSGVKAEIGIMPLFSDAKILTIPHSLGVAPDIVIVSNELTITGKTNRAMGLNDVCYVMRGSTTAPVLKAPQAGYTRLSTEVQIESVSASYLWGKGVAYTYMLGVLE